MENDKPVLIDELDFLDLKVDIYFYDDRKSESFLSSWQARNPDSFYVGYMYMNNETGKISYPKDAVIPEQTDRDRELVPKFIVTGLSQVSNEEKIKLHDYLMKEFKSRNNI